MQESVALRRRGTRRQALPEISPCRGHDDRAVAIPEAKVKLCSLPTPENTQGTDAAPDRSTGTASRPGCGLPLAA